MFATFWAVCGLPEGLFAVLPDSQFRRKRFGVVWMGVKKPQEAVACNET